MPRYQYRRRYWSMLKQKFNSVMFIPLLIGIIYGYELFRSTYLGEQNDLQTQIGMLKTEVSQLKNHDPSDLNSVRRDFQNKLTVFQSKVHKEVSDELLKMILCEINETSKKIAAEEIQLYDTDKTGKPDFAMESSGGSILSTRNTETFLKPALTFGISAGSHSHSVNSIIQANVPPGECWAFKGSKGAVVIRLTAKIFITGVSVEHIPSVLSPTGETSSAPKNISVWGLTHLNDEQEMLLGQFSYDNGGSHIQYFKTKMESNGKSFSLVEFKIHSNHGNPMFTCIYRIRVHGKRDVSQHE